MENFTTLVALIGIVIVVASLLATALERTGIPLAAVFLVLGAILGPFGLGLIDVGIDSPVLRVLATLGLALALFTDAVTTELADIRRHRSLLGWLLGPGTLLPAALTALAAWLLLGLSPAASALLGAALASTDAILLRRVLRARVLPATAQVALRLETGMNDVVLLPIILVAMLMMGGGAPLGGGPLARTAVSLLLVGPAIGAAAGWLGVRALTAVRSRGGVRRDYEALYAIALAFVAYAVAEAAGASGFVAAFAAGLSIGASDVELCDCFVEYGEATTLMLLLLTFVAFGASLIWSGLGILDVYTLLFAAVALTVRTIVLLLLLPTSVPRDERRLIALMGPRGISSLLLSLLPVFAGLSGGERIFSVTCLVVMLSIVVHGTGMALYLRRAATRVAPTVPDRITIDELQSLQDGGEQVIVADVRTDRSYHDSETRARGVVRLSPDNAADEATRLGLPREATIVLYCA